MRKVIGEDHHKEDARPTPTGLGQHCRGGEGGKRFSFIFSLDGCGDRLKCGVWRFAGAFVVPEGFSCLRCSRPWPARVSLLHTLRSSLAMPAQLTPKERRSVDAIARVQKRSVADALKTIQCSAVRSAVRHGVTPLRNLSDAYQTPIRRLSDTYQTPIRHLSDTYQTPIFYSKSRFGIKKAFQSENSCENNIFAFSK